MINYGSCVPSIFPFLQRLTPMRYVIEEVEILFPNQIVYVTDTFYTQDYLMDFNLVTSKEMRLIFFMDAIEHICRLARLLRAERGNGLLVGVGGMGKQSLTKLGAHLNGYRYSSYTNLYVLSFFILKINLVLKLLSTPNLYF